MKAPPPPSPSHVPGAQIFFFFVVNVTMFEIIYTVSITMTAILVSTNVVKFFERFVKMLTAFS